MSSVQSVDLTNCDREPIHIPGSIQQHGCLIACDVNAVSVQRHSDNCDTLLGLGADLNGKPLPDILGDRLTHDVRNALARTREGTRAALLFGQSLPDGRRADIAVHKFRGASILELEPAESESAQPLELARTLIGRVTSIQTTDRLVSETARLLQAMLGYDRVMVYRFGPDGAGKVVSEAKRADLESFLGQYFPATDIPQQARALYLKNTIRIISDAHGIGVPVRPVLDASGEPLDLSFAHLRSVSPIHLEYLRNMGVGASMSISIIVDGSLWGLIACHHYSPRTLTMSQRVAAEMFGEFFSLHLATLQHKQALDMATRAREALDRFLRETVRATDIVPALRAHLPDFAALMACDGAALWLDGQWTTFGTTPPEDAVPLITRFAHAVAEGTIWAGHKLSSALPEAEDFAADASGLLIVPLSQRPRDYLFYFRKEVVQTLDWAGNPDKTYEVGPLGDRLTPRKSFAIWKETVRGQATPWTDGERQFAEAARSALVEVVLQHTELLADERNKADIRQRMLNEELNHRVKNILAVIKSLVSQPTSELQSLKAYVESLRGRIQALALAHDQVIRGDGGGALRDLLMAELTPYRAQAIAIEGPGVWLDSRAYSILALVLHELATNAAKYGALSSTQGRLRVRWELDEMGAMTLSWRETGGPLVRPPNRHGFGTTLIDRSVPFDLGGKSDVRYDPEGLQAHFVIPARFVSRRDHVAPRPAQAVPQSAIRAPEATVSILIVEDQMLIALDLEQILDEAGFAVAATAGSAREALAWLERNGPDAAILDVNLGDETSEAVADALQARNIPFMFATGYGEAGAIPHRFSAVPTVRKPYAAETIARQLSRVLGRG